MAMIFLIGTVLVPNETTLAETMIVSGNTKLSFDDQLEWFSITTPSAESLSILVVYEDKRREFVDYLYTKIMQY
jgi:hypothetical protein